MNDREQFLATKAEREGRTSGRGIPEPPDVGEIQKALTEKAQCVRFYFEMLKVMGFDDGQALTIAAHAQL